MKKIYKQAIFIIVLITVIVFIGLGPIVYAISHTEMPIKLVLIELVKIDLLFIGLIGLIYVIYRLSEWADFK